MSVVFTDLQSSEMTPELPSTIVRTLTAVVRRRRWLALVQSLAWSSLGLGVLLAASPLALQIPDSALQGARWSAWVWSAAWLVTPALLLLLPVWIRTSSRRRVARAIDDRVPETADSLFTAVDLVAGRQAGRLQPSGATEELIEKHLAQAERAAGEVVPTQLLPSSSLGRRVLAGPAAALLAAAVILVWPDPSRSGLDRLFGALPPALEAAAQEDADVLPVTLVLKNLRLQLTPPAYSGRDVLKLEGTTGDFRALPGTRVALEADLPRSGGRAELEWQRSDDEAVAGRVQGKHLQVDFTTPGRSTYRVLLYPEGRKEPLRSRVFRVEALPDDPPELEVAGPADGSEIHPEDPVRLTVRASDDFALTRLRLVAERRGRRVARVPLADVAGQSRWDGSVDWIPGEHLKGKGGKIALVVEAWDNDTVRGPKVTRSRPVDIYVPTPRDHHQRVLAAKRLMLDQSLELLAELLVVNASSGDRLRRDRVLSDFEHQDRLATALFETAAELARAMEQDEFERRDVYLGIGLLVQNLGRVWSPLRETVESRVRPEASHHLPTSVLVRLRDQREEAISELERIVLDLSAFIDLQVGEDIDSELAELEPTLAELSSLIRQAEEGKPVDAEIQRALEELASSLKELAREMAERSGGPDDGFTNKVPQELSEDLLSEVQRLLEEGRHAEAMEKLRQAMEAVSAMREQLSKEGEQMAGSQISSELQRQISESLAELQELEKRQEEVIEQTRSIQERLGDGSGTSPAQRAGLLKDIEKLRDLIEGLPPSESSGMFRAEIRNWSRVADRLSFSLRESFLAGELEDAASFAESAGTYLEEIGRVSRSAASGTEGRAQALKDSEEGLALASDLAERLRKARERATAHQQQAASGSEGVRQQQQGVREGVGQLQEQMEGMGGSAYNPVQGREQLGTAGQLMERAEARLGEGEMGGALASEQDALRQLQALRESLEQSQQALQQGQRMGKPGAMAQGGAGQQSGNPWRRTEDWGGGSDSSRAEVEMSDPDDFLSPEAFRALVQEEASGDAPERYRPLNNSYYEELVR